MISWRECVMHVTTENGMLGGDIEKAVSLFFCKGTALYKISQYFFLIVYLLYIRSAIRRTVAPQSVPAL